MPHPALRDQLLELADAVRKLRLRDPAGWQATPKAKMLKRILEVMTDEVPRDPASPAYQLGNTLGADARGWRRVKFLGRFRLFFRYDARSKVIVYAWANDENTLRKAGAASDPYTVFRAMLVAGNPPHDWDKLLEACRTKPPGALENLLGPLAPLPDVADERPQKPKKSRRRT